MRKLLLFLILLISQAFYSQSDCVTAIPICGNSDISYTPSGPGNIIEILNQNGGCLSTNERYSVWYTFTVATSGTLAFTIQSNVLIDDYDFAVYGPTANGCASLQDNSHVFVQPLRCNYYGSVSTGATGLSLTVAPPAVMPPTTSTMNAQEWSPYINALAGQTYYLVIDNYSRSTNGFSLQWSGTASLASAFNDPAISPNPFIAPGLPGATPDAPNEVPICGLPNQFNFDTLSGGIVNGNPHFSVSYHSTINDAITGGSPLASPSAVNGTAIYYYRVKYTDPDNPDNPINKCFITGKFKFKDVSITARNATLKSCNNNNLGTATFNLTTADVYGIPGTPNTATIRYYPTLNDRNAGTNEITNPAAYVSAEKTVYVKVTSALGCIATSTIQLQFNPTVILKDVIVEECYIDKDITNGLFDLTKAPVTTQTGLDKKFYKTLADAKNETNVILNATNYITTNTEVYVRATNTDQCYSIAKITLKVLPPVKSAILKDKTICAEDTTTLDAGPGFDGYEWSTGATTQTIKNVGIGAYWVKLKTGKCFTLQQVHIYPSQQPVIANIEITNNTIKVNASGGTPPYLYSLDGIKWQESNTFEGLPRGDNKIFLKDSFDCTPIQITVTVPNLINAITPNGDNVNDAVDYSALSYKKNLVFIVYDRYGNKLYEADKTRGFKWDGTASGKKISTGTYWYTISWNENDKNSTETKYSGWILVKNRE